MDIELFLSSFNTSNVGGVTTTGNTPNKQQPKIKVKLVVESGGSTYEKSLESTNDQLKPLIIKLNNKIKKYEESLNKKNFVTPNKQSSSSMNLLQKSATVNLSSTSMSHIGLTHHSSFKNLQVTTSPDIQPAVPSNPIVFGVSLDTLIAKEKSMELRIPTFVSNILNTLFLHSLGVEGLFRISGSQVEIQNRRGIVNLGDYSTSRDDNPHVLTVLLKQFLRDLPEPICTNGLYDLFLAASDQINFQQCKDNGFEVLKKLINNNLPVNNRNLLQHIIHFLRFVAMNQSVNLMGSSNLSRVFGPNLFWKKESGPLDIQILQSTSEKVNFITEQMIIHYDSVFEEPLQTTSPAVLSNTPTNSNPASVPTGNFGGKKLVIHSKLLGHNKSIQWMALCGGGSGGDDCSTSRVWSLDSHGMARIWDSQSQQFIKEVEVVDQSKGGGAVYQMISTVVNDTVWTATSQRLAIWDIDGGLIGEVPGESYSLCESQNKEIWVGGPQVLNIYSLDGMPSHASTDGELLKPIGTNLFMKGIIILAMCRVGQNRIWGCSSEKTLYVWDTKTKETIHQCEIQEKRPKRMACIEIDDTEYIWIGGDEGSIQIFNSKTFKLEHKILNQGWDKIFHIASINREIWIGFWDTTVRVFPGDPKNKEILIDYKGYHSDVVSSIIEVPNLKGGDPYIWFGSYDKSISIVSIKEDTSKSWNFTNIKKNFSRPIRQGFSSRG
ncbi:hypothetical protein RB653_009534 [Dictyostelium firmibasis]|uniref:Rho-GAP domain-containing protein n=1 Tax=Dictyostelium firmibasis TaxID=79012 RepID=A0AAN7YVH5_9MYCE